MFRSAARRLADPQPNVDDRYGSPLLPLLLVTPLLLVALLSVWFLFRRPAPTTSDACCQTSDLTNPKACLQPTQKCFELPEELRLKTKKRRSAPSRFLWWFQPASDKTDALHSYSDVPLTPAPSNPSSPASSLPPSPLTDLSLAPAPSPILHRVVMPRAPSPLRESAPTTWVERMVVLLKSITRTRRGDIDAASYLDAMGGIPEVYDSLLSLPVVTAFMRRDLNGHIRNVRSSMGRIPNRQGDTLQGIVRYALVTYDLREMARKTTSMVGGVLWLNRATTFIAAFIRGLADGLPSDTAAKRAYEQTLQRYHTLLTSAFVSRATSLCPDRSTILEKLHLPSEAAARQQLARLLGLLEPLVEEIRTFLDEAGANFPDRIG